MLKRNLILFGLVFILLSAFVLADQENNQYVCSNTLALGTDGNPGPVAVRHFALNETTVIEMAQDSCGSGSNGSFTEGEDSDLVPGRFNNSFSGNGDDENLNTSYSVFINDLITISFWINTSDTGGYLIGLPQPADPAFRFGIQSTNDLWMQVDDNTSEQHSRTWVGAWAKVTGTPLVSHHVALVINGSWGSPWNYLVYVDGQIQTGSSESAPGPLNSVSLKTAHILGVVGASTASTLRAQIDEVIIFDVALNASQILTLNNTNYTTLPPPPAVQSPDEFINLTVPYPSTNTQYNFDTLNFNVSVNATNDFTARLYFNGSLNQTRTFSAGIEVFVSFNATMLDSHYDFHINASETANATRNDTTGINIFYISTELPSIETSFQTNSIFFNNFLIANFNLTDDFELFSFNVSINGAQKDYLTDLNLSFYQINFTENLENYTVGVYNLSLFVADGHTAKFIPDWEHSSNPITKSLTYDFDDDWVKIIPQGFDIFDSFNTQKKYDRYSFTHDRAFFSEKQTYTVKSNKEIVVVKNSRFPGWLIVPSLNKWIDFDIAQDYKKVTTKVISNYEVEVIIEGLKDKDLVFNSIGELNTITKSYQFFVGNVTTTLTTPILETEITTYYASFLINTSFITNINATLNWKGSIFSPDTKTAVGNYINFSYSKQMPLQDESSLIQINWNYTIYGINNSEVNSTDNQTQSILDFSLESCNQTNENVTLVLVPRNEEGDNPIQNVSVDLTLDFFINQLNITKKTITFNFTGMGDSDNGYNYSICLKPKDRSFLIDAFIDYEKELFSQRNYFLRKFNIGNNNITSVFLYLINDSKDSDVTVELTNEEDDPLVEYFVKVLRFYPGNNSFKTVEIGRTSNEGKSLVRLIQNDVWYKFIINSDNTTIFISNVQKVLSTTLFIQIITGDSFLGTIEKVQSLDYSFTYNNVTGVYLFIWNDLNNIVREGRLRVVQKGVDDTVVCDDTVSSTAGSISCTINISTNAIFIGTAYIDTTTKNSLFPLKVIETYLLEEFQRFGVLGLLIQIMILNVMVGIGLWRPSGALIFAAVSVIIGGVTGIVGITYGTIIVIVALIILFIGLIRD